MRPHRILPRALLAALIATGVGAVATPARSGGVGDPGIEIPGVDVVGIDSTEIEIITAGHAEVLHVDDLAIGETRYLATDSGTPATISRDAGGFTVELDGRSHRIELPDVGALEGGRTLALIDGEDIVVDDVEATIDGELALLAELEAMDDAEVGGVRVVKLLSDEGDGAPRERVIVVKHGDADADAADGTRIRVKRHLTREPQAQ